MVTRKLSKSALAWASCERLKAMNNHNDFTHESAEALQDQLARLERLALVAGLTLAADWVRDHHAHATVWVEDGNSAPEKMFAWTAKERKLSPITCSVCGRIATEVDTLHPYHQEWDRCAAHVNT